MCTFSTTYKYRFRQILLNESEFRVLVKPNRDFTLKTWFILGTFDVKLRVFGYFGWFRLYFGQPNFAKVSRNI